MKLIDENKEKLFDLCKSHNVNKLYLFGSILTERFDSKSDVDILIQFSSVNLNNYFDNYMNFKESVEKLFDRVVDLVEDQAITNPIFRKIVDRDKKLIYG